MAVKLVLPRVRTLIVNNNNASLSYAQDSENGWQGGVYFYDIAAEKTFLYEEPTNSGSLR